MRVRLSLENSLYLLAFAAALLLRLVGLGAAPLNDSEAQWAVQAVELGNGVTSVGAQPGYVVLTSLLFKFFPSTNAAARLIPALLGSLIVFLPALLRAAGNRLNFPRLAAVALAFGLAIDPTLAVSARQIGSPTLALTCTFLALAAMLAQRPILAGVFGGLAILGGPGTLHGLLGLALAYGLAKLLEKADWLAPLSNSADGLPESEAAEETAQNKARLRTGLYAGGATILIAGTLFLAYPLGLSGLAASLTSFINGWVTVSAVSPLAPLAALAIYETLPLLFGTIGLLVGLARRNGLVQRLSLWLLTAFVLAIVYPARQVVDLVWALVPLWGLAALGLEWVFLRDSEEKGIRWVAFSHALFLFVLLAILRLNLLGWQNSAIGGGITIGLVVGIVLMGAVATAMVAVGWSARTAIDGLAGALVAGGLVSMMAATFWGTVGNPIRASSYELWDTIPMAGHADLLNDTLEQLSVAKTGLSHQIDILATVDTPSMRWLLRNFPNTRFTAQLAVTEQPSIVITAQDETDLQGSTSYRGQDFAWEAYPAWQGPLPPAWLNWLAFRDAPLAKSNVILWARADLFPDSVSVSEGQ
ncbi:MAG: hypothetical protein ACOYYS_16920 [Chloroflexota bacterium]